MAVLGDLSVFDIVVVSLYFVALFILVFILARFQRKKSGSKTDGYFLASHAVPWPAVTASLFASNIGSEHFVGLCGTSAATGIASGVFEIGAIPCLIFFALYLLPVYMNSAVKTTLQWLNLRYSTYCEYFVLVASLVLSIFSKISVTLYAGQLIITEVVQINKELAVLVLVAITSVYTILGGLEAVIYTETLQTVILLAGGAIVLVFSLQEAGGWSGMISGLDEQNLVEFMHFFRAPSDPEYPATGFILGFAVIGPWYWGIDMVMAQRGLAAKNIAHGQLGCLGACALKFLPFFMMVVPGLCARVILYREMGDPSESNFNYDTSYAWLLRNVVPPNLRGIILSGMLSSLMSSLASVFNSSATIFSLDVWKHIRPASTEKELVLVGRVAVFTLALVSILWLFFVIPSLGDSLYILAQKPPAYCAPPILAVFVWGMLSRIPTARGAEVGLSVATGLGVVRYIVEVVEDVKLVESRSFLTALNYMHFAAISFWLTTALLFGVSLLPKLNIRIRSNGNSDPAEVPSTDGNSRFEACFYSRSLYLQLMNRYMERTSLDGVLENDSNIAKESSVKASIPDESSQSPGLSHHGSVKHLEENHSENIEGTVQVVLVDEEKDEKKFFYGLPVLSSTIDLPWYFRPYTIMSLSGVLLAGAIVQLGIFG